MNAADSLNTFLSIDFGEIDGLYDPNICDYFLDQNYWEDLVEGRKFYVIGRKGTGKSAIYNWIKRKSSGKDTIVSNLSFKNFPFEKLLRLTDDDYSKPNQYQSMWRNIILSEICKCLLDDPHKNTSNSEFEEISKYVSMKFGTELTELHAKVTIQTVKNESGLQLGSSSSVDATTNKIVLDDGFTNITRINSRLEKVLKKYLSTTKTSRIVVQFDQLDDNYTVFIKNDEYFQSIISLFKVIYDINQNFYSDRLPVKVIGYLRSDIFYEINKYDAESARWDAHKLFLNWTIVNKSDWGYPLLLQMLDNRIWNSCPQMRIYKKPFSMLFRDIKFANKETKNVQSVFSYMVRRSFQRPRDILQFCIKLQADCRKWKRFNSLNVKDSEKVYSLWLLTEIANEYGPQIKDVTVFNEFLRSIGGGLITYSKFLSEYKSYESQIGLDGDDVLKLLYRLGMINNVNLTKSRKEYYSIIRNEQSTFDKSMFIELHRGILKGLHSYSKE